MKTNHTPTPWKISPVDDFIIRGPDNTGHVEILGRGFKDQARANAAFIVRAVNTHEDLLDVLSSVLRWMNVRDTAEIFNLREKIEEVIAKAEGK